MEVLLLYVSGCPHWRLARGRLQVALAELRLEGVQLTATRVTTPEVGECLGFHGSPTVLIDGRDAFPGCEEPAGLACRLYETETGTQGAPSLAQIKRALQASAPPPAERRP